jgi:hypothetical protein
MNGNPFDDYLKLRQQFAVTRESAVRALEWAEPLAREALGHYAHREKLGLGEQMQIIPVLTTPADNGGWGEMMPAWFKPYERPLPLFILDNWATPALCWRYWLGDIGPAFCIDNLLKIFTTSSILIPLMPATQRGGAFLRQGALTVLLGLLWLPPAEHEPFLAALPAAASRFAERHRWREKTDLAQAAEWLEAEAFLMVEGQRIHGEEKLRAFFADTPRFESFAALYGGLSFSLAALYHEYGPNWQDWIYQAANVHYRYAAFGLEAWAKWLSRTDPESFVGNHSASSSVAP